MSVCNLVRISRHRGCLTNACSAYSTLQNLKQLPTNVIGATCVTRQPGTHSVASPSAHVVTQSSCRFKSLHVSDTKTSFSLGVAGTEVLPDFTQLDDDLLQQDVCQNINKTLKLGQAGRLYAVVYLRSQQHKVTPGDIIIVKLDFPPNVGDRIRLEKHEANKAAELEKKRQLRKESTSQNAGPLSVVCPHCQRSFRARIGLISHLRTHTDETSHCDNSSLSPG